MNDQVGLMDTDQHAAWQEAPAGRLGRHSRRPGGAIPLRQRLTYGGFLVVGLFLAARFALFWFSPQRLPHDFGRNFGLGDVALFGGLTFVIWHRQVMDIVSWLVCRRMDPHREPPRPATGLRVAFITTFVPASESLDMLRRTLRAMLAADYPHDTWLLDEGNTRRSARCAAASVSGTSAATGSPNTTRPAGDSWPGPRPATTTPGTRSRPSVTTSSPRSTATSRSGGIS